MRVAPTQDASFTRLLVTTRMTSDTFFGTATRDTKLKLRHEVSIQGKKYQPKFNALLNREIHQNYHKVCIV